MIALVLISPILFAIALALAVNGLARRAARRSLPVARPAAATPSAPAVPEYEDPRPALISTDRELLAHCRELLGAYMGEPAGELLSGRDGRHALLLSEQAFLVWPIVRENALARASTSGVLEDGRVALLGAPERLGRGFVPEAAPAADR